MTATPFAARLAAAIVVVVLAASVLTITLDYMKFRRVLRTQEDLVYLFVAQDLAGAIEDGMNLGLPLAALQATDQLIRRRRAAERGTLSIAVFDSTGTVLFDTDRFRVGSRLPPDWLSGAGEREWRRDLPGAYLVGAAIINNFGQTGGGVAVRYDPVALESRMNAILLDMVRAGLAVLALTAALAITAASLLTRRYRAWFQRAMQQIGVPGPAGAPGADAPEPALDSIRATGAALDGAEAELMRLGTAPPEMSRAA